MCVCLCIYMNSQLGTLDEKKENVKCFNLLYNSLIGYIITRQL